jgi:hypothetical protein
MDIKPINAKSKMNIKFPPNKLKSKVGMGGFDEETIEHAQEVVKKYVAEFDDRALKISTELEACTKKLPQGDQVEINPMLYQRIYKITHDLKGEGATFGHPVISIISGILLKYLDCHDARRVSPIVIKSHTDALMVILKHGLKSSDNQTVQEICKDLMAMVEKLK